MATVNNLSEAFFQSLVYFLRQAAGLNSDFADRMWWTHPGFNLSNQTLPFILVRHYHTGDEFASQPDVTGYESRDITFSFDIMVYCQDHAHQQHLPQLVKRTIESATVSGESGIQVYSGFDANGDPDVGSELDVAEPFLGAIVPIGSEEEEDVLHKFASSIEGEWSVFRDKTKKFISTNT